VTVVSGRGLAAPGHRPALASGWWWWPGLPGGPTTGDPSSFFASVSKGVTAGDGNSDAAGAADGRRSRRGRGRIAKGEDGRAEQDGRVSGAGGWASAIEVVDDDLYDG
jgi:hypothetical protein